MNLYLTKKIFKKDDTEFIYFELCVDLGYKQIIITKDREVIKSLLDLTDRALYSFETDIPSNVGTLEV